MNISILSKTKEFIEKKGEFNQKEVCRKLIDRFNELKKVKKWNVQKS